MAAVFDDLEGETSPDYFHCFVQHDGVIRGEVNGILMNTELIREIASIDPNLPPPIRPLREKEVAPHFREWLKAHGYAKNDCVVVAGKNFARCDQRFLERLPDWNKIRIRSGSLDPGILYMRPKDTVVPGLAECMERAGLPFEVKHRALDDALAVIALIRKAFLG